MSFRYSDVRPSQNDSVREVAAAAINAEKELSRGLSRFLRRKADKYRVCDADGFVPFSEVLSRFPESEQQILHVLNSSCKRGSSRFEVKEHDGRMLVRAAYKRQQSLPIVYHQAYQHHCQPPPPPGPPPGPLPQTTAGAPSASTYHPVPYRPQRPVGTPAVPTVENQSRVIMEQQRVEVEDAKKELELPQQRIETLEQKVLDLERQLEAIQMGSTIPGAPRTRPAVFDLAAEDSTCEEGDPDPFAFGEMDSGSSKGSLQEHDEAATAAAASDTTATAAAETISGTPPAIPIQLPSVGLAKDAKMSDECERTALCRTSSDLVTKTCNGEWEEYRNPATEVMWLWNTTTQQCWEQYVISANGHIWWWNEKTQEHSLEDPRSVIFDV